MCRMSASGRAKRDVGAPKTDFSPPKLCSLIKKHRCLWDITDDDYKNEKKKEAKWKEIADKFWDMTG